jgi:hypothetical protein
MDLGTSSIQPADQQVLWRRLLRFTVDIDSTQTDCIK